MAHRKNGSLRKKPLLAKSPDATGLNQTPSELLKTDSNGFLYSAALHGSLDQVPPEVVTEEAFTRKMSAGSSEGRTAMHAAAAGGHLDQVPCVLLTQKTITVRDNRGQTPLHRAAAWGHLDQIPAELLNAENLELQDNCGTTPLEVAIQRGHTRQIPANILNAVRSRRKVLLDGVNPKWISFWTSILEPRSTGTSTSETATDQDEVLFVGPYQPAARYITGDISESDRAWLKEFVAGKGLVFAEVVNTATPEQFRADSKRALKRKDVDLLYYRADAEVPEERYNEWKDSAHWMAWDIYSGDPEILDAVDQRMPRFLVFESSGAIFEGLKYYQVMPTDCLDAVNCDFPQPVTVFSRDRSTGFQMKVREL